MAGKVLEATVIKMLIALRDPIIIFSVITSWMTFAILNREPTTTQTAADDWKDGTWNFVWTVNLSMAIFITMLAGLVVMKYVIN